MIKDGEHYWFEMEYIPSLLFEFHIGIGFWRFNLELGILGLYLQLIVNK